MTKSPKKQKPAKKPAAGDEDRAEQSGASTEPAREERPAAKPKPATQRVIGVGAQCPRCKGTNTLIRNTRAHPHFIAARRRYHTCSDCGFRWRTDR